MDAKDFIFPGVIFALVIIIGLGLLWTHTDRPVLVPTGISSSTAASTSLPTAASSSASATNTPSTTRHPYGSVTLALGQAVTFEDGTTIRPMRILEDSRCPVDVECIQAGTVKLTFSITNKGSSAAGTLTIGQSIKQDGDTITLDSVAPQKKAGGYPAANEYRFTFTVQHG